MVEARKPAGKPAALWEWFAAALLIALSYGFVFAGFYGSVGPAGMVVVLVLFTAFVVYVLKSPMRRRSPSQE